MPILGNLSEFPLPEVLLLIGARTGKLRLLDVPAASVMELDLCLGEVQALHLDGNSITRPSDLIDTLGNVVISRTGMFDFKLQPIIKVPRENPLPINQLVITLVCHVDQQLEKRKTSRLRYELSYPVPEVWIEPSLNAFLITASNHLTSPGIYQAELAEVLGMDQSEVAQNLINLWHLGIVRLADEPNVKQVVEEVHQRSNAFLQASRITARLPAYTQRATTNP